MIYIKKYKELFKKPKNQKKPQKKINTEHPRKKTFL